MIKELKNEERVEQKGSKFVYTQERIVEMEFADVLAVATNSKANAEEMKRQIEQLKQERKRKQDFLTKNKKVIDLAQKEAEKQFCEKCGMDFAKKENKNMRSMKVSSIYKVLCKNCAKEVHD